MGNDKCFWGEVGSALAVAAMVLFKVVKAVIVGFAWCIIVMCVAVKNR